MPSSFPTTIDDFLDPSSTNYEDDPGYEHYLVETNQNRAINTIETYLGVSGSAVASSITYKLSNTAAGHNHDGANSRSLPQIGNALWIGSVIAQSGTTAAMTAANDMKIEPVWVTADFTVNKLRIKVVSLPSGNCQVGIYRNSGTKLFSSASTLPVTGWQDFTVSPGVVLTGGTRCFFTLWCDNATTTFGAIAALGLTGSDVQNPGAGGSPASFTPTTGVPPLQAMPAIIGFA